MNTRTIYVAVFEDRETFFTNERSALSHLWAKLQASSDDDAEAKLYRVEGTEKYPVYTLHRPGKPTSKAA